MLGNDEGEQTAYPVEFGGTDVGEMTSEGKGGGRPSAEILPLRFPSV